MVIGTMVNYLDVERWKLSLLNTQQAIEYSRLDSKPTPVTYPALSTNYGPFPFNNGFDFVMAFDNELW